MTELPARAGVGFKPDHFDAIHGVGVSIGGAGGLDPAHLARLRALCDRYQPESFSEHPAWSSHGAEYLNDLLPLPYTEETLARVACHVDRVQDRLGRRMLLDVNNVFVSCTNHRRDASAYLAEFPMQAVEEIHLGGHDAEDLPAGPLLIDSHGAAVADPVWTLYAAVIARIGPCPTLVEWDNDLPDWSVLRDEAARADHLLRGGLAHAC